MSKDKISDYSQTANSNTDIGGINVDEGCAPSGINNAIRTLMKQLKDFQQGTNSDSFNGPTNGAHNGTVGATTPAAGTFTTLTASGNVVLGDASTDTLNVGNGGLIKDASGNLGLGVTPSAWSSSWKAFQFGSSGALVSESTANTRLYANTYFDGTNNKYINNDAATLYYQVGGTHRWYYATTGTAGATFSFSEAMRIDSSGNLLVGTTDSGSTTGIGIKNIASATAPQLAFVGSSTSDASDAIRVYSTGAAAYRFEVTYAGKIYATTTTVTGISDQRLKENIRDLDDGLTSIMALQPRKFDWKEGKGADTKNARGFIAQEFEQVFPDLIEEWRDPAPEGENPYKAVRADLIPVLVKAIQEQQAIITQLQADVATLKGN